MQDCRYPGIYYIITNRWYLWFCDISINSLYLQVSSFINMFIWREISLSQASTHRYLNESQSQQTGQSAFTIIIHQRNILLQMTAQLAAFHSVYYSWFASESGQKTFLITAQEIIRPYADNWIFLPYRSLQASCQCNTSTFKWKRRFPYSNLVFRLTLIAFHESKRASISSSEIAYSTLQ